MIESDPITLLDRTGGETINLLRYSKIDNDALDKKFKFLADFVEKAKLKKRIKIMGGHKDAKVPSKKARYGYEEMGDSSSETESDESDESDESKAISYFLALDDSND